MGTHLEELEVTENIKAGVNGAPGPKRQGLAEHGEKAGPPLRAQGSCGRVLSWEGQHQVCA